MAYFKVTNDRTPFEKGEIVKLNIDDAIKAFNIYGALWYRDEEGDLLKWQNEEDYLVDESGRFINWQIFNHGANQVFLECPDFYTEEGILITDFTSFHHETTFIYYWDGNNYRGIIIWHDTEECGMDEYKWDGEFEVLEDADFSFGRRTRKILASTGVKMEYFESQFQGSFDKFTEI
jgi:hypothetical protein